MSIGDSADSLVPLGCRISTVLTVCCRCSSSWGQECGPTAPPVSGTDALSAARVAVIVTDWDLRA